MTPKPWLFIAAILVAFSPLASAKEKSATDADHRYYGVYDDGGEHPGADCEPAGQLPEKLAREKKMAGSAGYVGSEQTEFAEDNEATIDAWVHYFSSLASCEKAAKKLNDYYETGE